ncbi:MAG: ATP-dependent RecD-like DNA helicase [Chloroflexi bacterium]|nr:ATP-dependent RecD-like DNA helicase [Chloroflexota bacterium]
MPAQNPSVSPSLLTQQLEGVLERITYQNEENGYTIAKLIPRGKSQEITVVGTLTGANVGESLRLQGMWINHVQYGRQFEVRSFEVTMPATVEGLRKYLGSGLIKGIGPVNAGRIVDSFGIETLDVIESAPQRLLEVAGIGEKRVEMILKAWEEQKQIKEIMLFLQSNGVSTSLAVKIYKQYGQNAIQVVRTDPYRLARDIYGIGFKTADKIARQMGIAEDAPSRIQAGLLFALGQLSGEGHCFAERGQLLTAAAGLLEIEAALCEPQVDLLVAQGDLILEEEALYLPPFHYAEVGAAGKLRRIQTDARDRLAVFKTINWPLAFDALDKVSSFQLTEQQKLAVRMALTEKVSVLTGGPGTGKSTITFSIIQLLKERYCTVLLAAPTGRAAKRLSEATGLEAKTIHRLLEYSPTSSDAFVRDQENPLDADMIIIDETSMVDILLLNHLLSAIETGSHLVFVGDVDQLPSVGPGNVLRDMIDSGEIPVTRLDTIFRQSEDSYIIVNAHRINQGEFPQFSTQSKDFFLFPEEDAEKAADRVVELATTRIKSKFGFNPQTDIQVLSPMHRGDTGVSELNRRLQSELNPPSASRTEYRQGGRVFREGDRVMQIRNDYERKIFNGDMGVIQQIDLENQALSLDFEGRVVPCEYSQLDELAHAYAVSIHKSQGSEFPVVVIPILMQHYMMLQRNLLYTGVTRARKMVVLVGSKRAIARAVKNNQIARRNTRLASRLRTKQTR